MTSSALRSPPHTAPPPPVRSHVPRMHRVAHIVEDEVRALTCRGCGYCTHTHAHASLSVDSHTRPCFSSGNTIKNATTGVLLGGGRRNRIHSNIFIDNDLDIAFDNRGKNEAN